MKISLALAAAACVAIAAPSAAQQSLAGADVQKMLKNKRVSLACIDGTNGSGRYTMQENAGTILGSYTLPGRAAVADAGQVRAQGDTLCLTFKMLNGGAERCFDVSQTAPGKFKFAVSGYDACTVSAR